MSLDDQILYVGTGSARPMLKSCNECRFMYERPMADWVADVKLYQERAKYYGCNHPEMADPTEPERFVSCEEARHPANPCGREGLLFEAKPE